MKTSCTLPPISDILSPQIQHQNNLKYYPYSRDSPQKHQRKPSILQVSNLVTPSFEKNEEEQVKAKRKRASPSQLTVLNCIFEQTFFPSTELRIELGKQLGMSPRTVQIWFQNKRQSIRTKERVMNQKHHAIASPPTSPSVQHEIPSITRQQQHKQKPVHILLPPLRLPQPPTFPLTPSSSVQSSPTYFDQSILFRDH
ncbi:uncharacterized protein B0P05DRAFT_554016 [Gilbertella persicaria]|uniref:uncharacterized protein n=1 Tax=Gilbertella persicaria TaxID=101096 RepID=UPI00221E9304|nr:uncharacterized protein B0P05DRAFT_554016 [Gilbertella persicaria]KAI8065356.1 hypothetical protein B0P05DRAFT_554016 [Gilbertella persicaria]